MCGLLRWRAVLTILVALGGVCAAPAEEQARDNIGHRRHTHTWNAPHPRLPAEGPRFTTSRSGAALELPEERDAFVFVVFGDRTGGPAEGVAVLADAVRDTNLIEPDFVITVGDLINGYNQSEQWLEQMREYKGIMSHLLCPWFPVAGNHDTYWRGPKGAKPEGEHDSNYEKHFGPLWYAFEHKNCWFIALYSDEGNPETGEKNFRKPECQKMSPEQFNWLRATLEQARDAEHVFLFLHHPRWLKGNYGDDWDRVHELLKSAGNVSAVFAGHIHNMRYDGPRDGIEYVTLATVGGGQSGVVPSAGWLHQFHIVHVRQNQVALASVPVGEVMDVREITGELKDEMMELARLRPTFAGPLAVRRDGSSEGQLKTTISNPSDRPIEVLVSPESEDSRWYFAPSHNHRVLQPGESFDFVFLATRPEASLDEALRVPELALHIDYLTEGSRYPVPSHEVDIPLHADLPQPVVPADEHAAAFDGENDYLEVDDEEVHLPDGPLTLECWFNADQYGGRTGLVTKTEGSEFGIFVSKGVPEFAVHLDGKYAVAKAEDSLLRTKTWHHVAGVYDGEQVRLYVDGELITHVARTGKRTRNGLPLLIGADVRGNGTAMSHFDGRIDAVRLSSVARHAGKEFQPVRRPASDENTVLLFNMDGTVGPWVYDESAYGSHAQLMGRPRVAGVSRGAGEGMTSRR